MKSSSILPLALTALVGCFVACGGDEPAVQDTEATPATASSTGGAAAPSSEAVTYEPAYPEEVSSEALSEEDVSQQEAAHSHAGGDDPAHDDGEHSHAGDVGDDHGHDH